MPSSAIAAQGTLLKLESDSSVGTFTTIPEVKKIGAPSIKFDLLDVTNHDSTGGFKEYIPGLADGDNCTFEFNLLTGNALHIQLRTDSYAKTKKNMEVIFPGGGTGAMIAFAAYVVGLNAVADSGAILMETGTAKVTGQPTWT